MSSLVDPTGIAAAIQIVARVRMRKTRHIGALGPLGVDEVSALEASITRVVQIARAGRGVSVPPKWKRERIARQLVGWLRQGRVHVLNSPGSRLTDVDLTLFDLGLINAPKARDWISDPERGADEIEEAIRRHRQTGFYGQIARTNGSQATNRSGGKRDLGRLSVIIDAIEIFAKFACSPVKSSRTSPGAAFVAAVLTMAGYETSGLPQAIAQANAVMTLSDVELERRKDGA